MTDSRLTGRLTSRGFSETAAADLVRMADPAKVAAATDDTALDTLADELTKMYYDGIREDASTREAARRPAGPRPADRLRDRATAYERLTGLAPDQ